jgi:D-alanine-D-alanine ligase
VCMTQTRTTADIILRPIEPEKTRVLYLAEYAPEPPTFSVKRFDGDGGYPDYHHEIWRALCEIGYPVTPSARPSSALLAKGNVDYVFSLYNRMPVHNSEVLVSAFCEYVRIPYVGARPNIRALAEDKWLCKLVARSIGLPVAPGIPYGAAEQLELGPNFPGPYFVKDRFGAGSEGIVARCFQETWHEARSVAAEFIADGTEVLVEQFAHGIDVTLPVLGGQPPIVLGLVHPRSNKPGNILTEDLKLNDPLGYELFDAGSAAQDFREDAFRLWSAVGPIDYLRLDYRYDPRTGKRIFLEFNICCFIGSSGAISMAADEVGISHHEVLGHVMEYSLRRQRFGWEKLQWVQ